jgi:hypothetical protein
MKKLSLAVIVAVLAFCQASFAADRENYYVTTLLVGTNAQQVSGDSTQLLESLLANGDWNGYTSGSSLYRIFFNPDGSPEASASNRTDLLHIGDAANAYSTNWPMVGTYISVSRPVGANASSTFSGGTFDTGLRVDSLNAATNDATQYSIRGAHIKAKNYTTGTVKGVEGLFVEAIGAGTETAGNNCGIKLGSDSTTIDYGIDMNLLDTLTYADFRLSNGALIQNGDANTLTITEATVAISGAATVSTTLGVTGLASLNNVTVATNATVSGILTVTGIPAINTPLGTAGTNVLLTSNGPDNSVAAAKWIPITHNGTNLWICAWPRN